MVFILFNTVKVWQFPPHVRDSAFIILDLETLPLKKQFAKDQVFAVGESQRQNLHKRDDYVVLQKFQEMTKAFADQMTPSVSGSSEEI